MAKVQSILAALQGRRKYILGLQAVHFDFEERSNNLGRSRQLVPGDDCQICRFKRFIFKFIFVVLKNQLIRIYIH